MENQKITAPDAHLIRTGDNGFITVVMMGESYTVRANDNPKAFEKALECFRNKDWEGLFVAMRPVRAYATKIDNISIKDGQIFYFDRVIHNSVAERILQFAEAGLNHEPLCRFLDKLMLNPSKRAVDELYTFLEHENLPITDNGNILAYKGVQNDYYSVTAGDAVMIKGKASNGRIYNGVGEEIEIPRNQVDDNKDRGCSYGLHAGTMEYAVPFGPRCVIVEINPKDVVSIPTDCSFQKLRTCAYKVVGEFEGALTAPVYESNYPDPEDTVAPVERNPSADNAEYCDNLASSWINSAEYTPYEDDNDFGDLIIQIGSEYYEYYNVPRRHWDGLRDANSAGRYYNLYIKDVYS